MDASLPVQYSPQSRKLPKSGPGKYKQQAIGFGKRYDFTKVKNHRVTPGPEYEDHQISSMSAEVDKRARSSKNNTFYYKWQEMDKVCHDGMAQHYYLKHSPGVGSYEIVNPER